MSRISGFDLSEGGGVLGGSGLIFTRFTTGTDAFATVRWTEVVEIIRVVPGQEIEVEVAVGGA